MIDELVSTCEGACSDGGEVFVFSAVGTASGALSEVVGETMITLSRDNELWSTWEGRFNEP